MKKSFEDKPAEKAEEELERIISYLEKKSLEFLDEDYRESYPHLEKSKEMRNLKYVIRKELIPENKGRDDVKNVLNETLEWFEDKIDTKKSNYNLSDMSAFVIVTREIRRRLINYEEGLHPVTLKVREKWEDKYGQDK